MPTFCSQNRRGAGEIAATVNMAVIAATGTTLPSCHQGLHGTRVAVTTDRPTNSTTEPVTASPARTPTTPIEITVTANAAKPSAKFNAAAWWIGQEVQRAGDEDEVDRLHDADAGAFPGVQEQLADEDHRDAGEDEAQPEPHALEEQAVAALDESR